MKNIKLMLGMFVFSILVLASVSADTGEYSHGMMSGSYGFGGMIFGWIIGFLFVVVLVLLIVWLTKQIQKK